MPNEETGKIVFLTLITGRSQKDAILTALLEAGIHLINTSYGRGTVNAGYLQNTLGLIPDKHKAIITCVTTSAKADNVLTMLVETFNFTKPNTGIAFTMPVDGLSF